jgi:predicted  nucleic acid-binding Zn-ribbon protein
MALDDEHAASSLGERLRQGVLNLWNEVSRIGKVLDHHGTEIETMRNRLKALEQQAHGLRVSRGRTKAKSRKLESALIDSERKLAEIKSMLN